MAAFHEGWGLDKIAKTLKLSLDDVSKIRQARGERIASRRDEFDTRPFIPVIREADYLQ